ncbi:MAG: hypothetical protein A3K68_00280 [Euryarchaeota archaeon RBG_16_68_13]|nr:MAG: hypothetical protein A3K68_00280 [Euryarchaeota archaeon RBG_16_68_13]
MEEKRSRWTARFIGITFLLGGVAWLLVTLLVLGNVLAGMEPPSYALGPASSRIVAGGGAGTWFVMGLLSFLLIGIVGLGMSALFYQFVEVTIGATLVGWRNLAAWIHLALGGGGAAAASLLMTWAGYQAGVAALDADYGGGEQTGLWIHQNVLGPIVLPIAILMALALLGYLVGGLAVFTAWWARRKG